uniref:Uncharacterized protein n=1 Tax=Anguilla anguilla TaxID=7936 RepID=A0A0E9V6H0_ANGAN
MIMAFFHGESMVWLPVNFCKVGTGTLVSLLL